MFPDFLSNLQLLSNCYARSRPNKRQACRLMERRVVQMPTANNHLQDIQTLEEPFLGRDLPAKPVSSIPGSREQHDLNKEGYNYEFRPQPDAQYECPVCLLVQQDPVQTQCGHRFCSPCIQRWLSFQEKTSCPVCTETISKETIHADNFAKREILGFRVVCPNHAEGCRETPALQYLDKHFEVCIGRQISCLNCGTTVSSNKMELHLQRDCPNTVVSCPFGDFSCSVLLPRKDLADRLSSSVEEHLRMLSSYVKQRSFMPTAINSEAGKITNICHQNGINGSLSENTAPTNYDLPSIRDRVLNKTNSAVEFPNSFSYLEYQDSSAKRDAARPSYRPIATNGALMSLPITDNQFDEAQSPRFISEPLANKDNYQKLVRNFQSPHYLSAQNVSLLDLNEDLRDGEDCVDGGCRRLQSLQSDQSPISIQAQVGLEQLWRRHKKLEIVVESQQRCIRDFEGRHCRGLYRWRIPEFSRRVREAVSRQAVAIHSPGFYTSFYGYKLCIRLNPVGVDQAKADSPQLALFIHFMKGEFDDTLAWPFCGVITLSILDQTDSQADRRHISETFRAEGSLQAFQRPTTFRNHKGFGYLEFASLDWIKSRHFLKNDTLIVQVKVKEESTSMETY